MNEFKTLRLSENGILQTPYLPPSVTIGMNWHHIMDKQPDHGDQIVYVERPYKGYHMIGVREYWQPYPFQVLLSQYKQLSVSEPDFWWMLASDFPFPDFENTKNLMHASSQKKSQV